MVKKLIYVTKKKKKRKKNWFGIYTIFFLPCNIQEEHFTTSNTFKTLFSIFVIYE